MNSSTKKDFMSVSLRARLTGERETSSLMQMEGLVSVAQAQDGTVHIKIKPVRPKRIPRRRGQTSKPPLVFLPVFLPDCVWLELSCIGLPRMSLPKKE